MEFEQILVYDVGKAATPATSLDVNSLARYIDRYKALRSRYMEGFRNSVAVLAEFHLAPENPVDAGGIGQDDGDADAGDNQHDAERFVRR